eukprot:scaffold633292_cov48-Prasinocladus_malaysianus.AAC.1
MLVLRLPGQLDGIPRHRQKGRERECGNPYEYLVLEGHTKSTCQNNGSEPTFNNPQVVLSVSSLSL